MNEPFESELRQFSPASASRDLRETIAASLQAGDQLSPANRSGDRLLVGAMSIGMAAAVAIVALLATDFSSTTPPAANNFATSAELAQNHEMLVSLAAGNDPFARKNRP